MSSRSIATWPPYYLRSDDDEDSSSIATQSDEAWVPLLQPSASFDASNNIEGPEEQPQGIESLGPGNNTILLFQTITVSEQCPVLTQQLLQPAQPTQSIEVTKHIVKPHERCQFYQFRENGDKMTLVVGSDVLTQITIVVSLDVIRNLSKVWKTFVDETKHRNKAKPWQSLSRKHAKEIRQITLPHDDPVMMLQVMKIAHHDFNGLFTTLDFKQTLAMALIAQKFQTNRLLIPFLDNWATPYKKKFLDPGYEQWLFIAWQFGFESDYLRLSRHLATHCKVDERGLLLNLAGDEVLTGHYPKGALDYIRSIRLRTLQSFLSTVYTHTSHMINTNTCVAVDSPTSTIRIPNSERTECTLLNYGSMIRQLRLLGFWPQIHNPADVLHVAAITDPLAEVMENLTNVQVLTWRYNRHNHFSQGGLEDRDVTMGGDERHKGCDSGKLLANKISAVMVRMDDCISNDTRDSLRRNARMCHGLMEDN